MFSVVKILNAFISILHFKTVVKISRLQLDRFCSNLQGLCKKKYDLAS